MNQEMARQIGVQVAAPLREHPYEELARRAREGRIDVAGVFIKSASGEFFGE